MISETLEQNEGIPTTRKCFTLHSLRKGMAELRKGHLTWSQEIFTVCIPLYMYTNLVCVELETSGAKSATNPTKPLQRCGRAQVKSSCLVAGRLFIDHAALYMHSNLVCIESVTSGTKRACKEDKALSTFCKVQLSGTRTLQC